MDSVQDIGNLVGRGLLLNQRQCQDLCSKVTQTAKNVQKLVLHFRADSYIEQFRPALENLCGVLERSRLLINDCSRADWCKASVFQMQNGEAFSEILMDLGLCYNVIYEQARGILGPDEHVQVEDLRKLPTFLPASKDEALQDQKTLRLRLEEQLARSSGLSPDQTRLKSWLQRCSFSSYDECLARYLLGKLEHMSEERMKEGLGMSNTLPWPNEMESQVKILHYLGQGGFAAVLRIEWLGMPSAMKIFELDNICDIPSACDIFRREAEILARLNHPHIVKFFCCGHDTINRQYYIGMELMEMNLYHFIQKLREEKKPFAYYLALHIMIQVARGMCYLHDQGIAHRDIKPHNVVISHIPSDLDLVNFLVKLVDFGMAKTRVHFSKSNTPSQNNIGTTNYRAPEVFCKARADFRPEYNTRVNWFKADVYSFALTCTELLTLEAPFQDLPLNMRCDVSSRLRWKPMFPSECPQELVALLEKCLDAKPQLRPNFREICITLERYKYDLLTPVTTGEEGYTYIDTLLTHHSDLRMQQTAKIRSPAGVKSKAPMLKSIQCIEDIANLVGRENLLNGSQCRDLSSKLYKTVKNVEELISHPGAASINDPHFLPALENFYRILEKSRLLVSDCSSKDWCRAALIQIQNEEAFREILVEMGLCYNVIYEKAREVFEQEEGHLQTEDLRQLSTFEAADGDQVGEDRKSLQQRLEKHAIDNNLITCRCVTGCLPVGAELSNDECALVGYLLHKLKLPSSEDLKFGIHDALLSANETETQVEIIGFLGKGASGTVFRTRWLGLPCATKYFRGDVFSGPNPNFLKEAAILASLNHPNVVKFFYCGHDPQKNELSLGMEAMEMDLHHLIRGRGEKEKPFPISVALDIMIQIASGMCYLHDMKIAHCDLKPSNVVVSHVPDTPYLEDRFCAKLIDFGVSKQLWCKEEGTSESARVGTTPYRAPELMSPQPQSFKPVQWFKADAFSFAVTCSEILTLQKAFVELPERPMHRIVLGGYRPDLPRDCPPQLAALIHEGWDTNPRSRPSFVQICTRLEMCKYDLLSSRFTADADVQPRRVEYPKSHKYIETTLQGRSRLRRRQHVATQVAIEHTVEVIITFLVVWIAGSATLLSKQHKIYSMYVNITS